MTHIHSSYVTTIHTVSTTIPQALYYSNYYVSMTSIYSLRHYDLYYRNNYYVTKALHYYSNYYVSMIYIKSSYVATIYRTLLHSINTNLCILFLPITTIMQQAMTTACPLLEDPRRCAHQERLGGR